MTNKLNLNKTEKRSYVAVIVDSSQTVDLTLIKPIDITPKCHDKRSDKSNSGVTFDR